MPLTELHDMVDGIKRAGYLHDAHVEQAMLTVDRVLFISPEYTSLAYTDKALPTLEKQTISAPGVVAFMLEKLDVKPGMHVLEIGTGSGYNTALLAELVGKKGRVISMEILPALCNLSRSNIGKLPKKYPQLKLLCRDAASGYPAQAPYDRIIVTAALPSLPPNHPFLCQLKPDGKLLAPVGDAWNQTLTLYDNTSRSTHALLPVLFVPLKD